MPALLFCLLASLPAAAVDLTVHTGGNGGWLLEPVVGGYTANGIGSPSIAYNRDTDEWVMFFETRFGASDPVACKGGVWGIGRATSTDGLNWTLDEDLVFRPVADSYYSCVMAHPEVVVEGDKWRLWFKAEQTSNACAASDTDVDPPWGCKVITGVGYAESNDGGETWEVAEEPVLNLAFFGYPSVTKKNDVWHMLLAYSNAQSKVSELMESISTDDGATWSSPSVVVKPGFASWVADEIYNPSLTCRNDDPWGFVLWAGGRDTTDNVINTAGLGQAFSNDGVNWSWDAGNPAILWQNPGTTKADWRHWDVVRIGDDYLIYFTQKDPNDRNRVGLAYTYPTQQTYFVEKRISDRICSTVAEQDTAAPESDEPVSDTDESDTPVVETDETDVPADSLLDSENPGDTDVDGSGGEARCGCDTSAPGFPAATVGLLLLALRRRRK